MLATAIISFSSTLFFGLAGLFGIGFVIALHEFGHYLFAKLFGIHTPSFSIGFGPRLITKKIGDTEFALSAIPLGGYVEIAGASEDDPTPAAKSFRFKPWYQKFIVMFAGISLNFVLAYAICAILFMVGMPDSMMLYPKNAVPVVNMTRDQSPAALAGIQQGDVLLAIDGQTINAAEFPSTIEKLQETSGEPAKPMTLSIFRNETPLEVTLTPEIKDFMGKKVRSLGIIFGTQSLPGLPFFQAIQAGITFANKLCTDSITALTHIFKSGDTSKVGGPIMIISQTMKGAQKGFKTFLLFLAYISLSLAVLNLLPLPILDGGQILFYTIEAIIGRSIPDKVREYIHIACWLGFMALVIVLSAQDLKLLLKPYLDSLYALIGW